MTTVSPTPTATPLPRMGWRIQAVLDALLEDPGREVWPYWLDQRVPGRDTYPTLKRLADAGWLTTRREPDGPNGASGRRLYRLTAAGEELAREAVTRPVKWPAGVPRRKPEVPPPYMETVDYPRRLITYALGAALDGTDPVTLLHRLLPADQPAPVTREETAGLALWMLGARPGNGLEGAAEALWGPIQAPPTADGAGADDQAPYLESVPYARRLITYALAVALDGSESTEVMRRLLPPGRLYPATRDGAASLAAWMLGARPGGGVEDTVRALWEPASNS